MISIFRFFSMNLQSVCSSTINSEIWDCKEELHPPPKGLSGCIGSAQAVAWPLVC